MINKQLNKLDTRNHYRNKNSNHVLVNDGDKLTEEVGNGKLYVYQSGCKMV